MNHLAIAAMIRHYRESASWGNGSTQPTDNCQDDIQIAMAKRANNRQTAIRMAMASLAYDMSALFEADSNFDSNAFMTACGL